MGNLKKLTAVFAALLMMIMFAAFMVTAYASPDEALNDNWSVDSPAAESLRNYVSKVTNKDDPDSFIPVKDRIAVFDMDGTLTCETCSK